MPYGTLQSFILLFKNPVLQLNFLSPIYDFTLDMAHNQQSQKTTPTSTRTKLAALLGGLGFFLLVDPLALAGFPTLGLVAGEFAYKPARYSC